MRLYNEVIDDFRKVGRMVGSATYSVSLQFTSTKPAASLFLHGNGRKALRPKLESGLPRLLDMARIDQKADRPVLRLDEPHNQASSLVLQ